MPTLPTTRTVAGAHQPHTILIEIAPDGTLTGTVQGVAGPACTSISAWLDEIGEVTEDRHTADFRKPGSQALTQAARK